VVAGGIGGVVPPHCGGMVYKPFKIGVVEVGFEEIDEGGWVG